MSSEVVTLLKSHLEISPLNAGAIREDDPIK
jgi:hypothetical protein